MTGKLWGALIVCVVLGFAWEFYPLPDASKRLAVLEKQTMGFGGVDLPLTEAEQAIFAKAHVIKRMYQSANACFLLLVVDGTNDRHCIHDPMYCFRGAGWRVVRENPVSIPGGQGRRVWLQKGGEEREVLYWFSDGVTRYDSAFKYWLQTTLRRLTLGLLGEEPVLVEIQPCAPKTHTTASRILGVFVPLQEI